MRHSIANTTTVNRFDALQQELDGVKSHLQSTTEELEASSEELQATNEELMASNEELQSTNEELHSVNEELHTVNLEHQRKIDELSQLNDDLNNMFQSTFVSTIFVDSELRIRRYSSGCAAHFDLLNHDLGRSLSLINHALIFEDLVPCTQRVLDSHQPESKTVQSTRGQWLHAHLLPYETERGEVDGVILTFIDITEQRQLWERFENAHEELQQVAYRTSHDLIAPIRNVHRLLSEDPFEPESRELAQGELSRVEKCLEDLLQYSRVVTRGKAPEPLNLREALNKAIEFKKEDLEEVNGAISAVDLDRTVFGDRSQIARVFTELLANAIHFRSEHRLQIVVTSQQFSDFVRVSFKDNGRGMPSDLASKAFDVFTTLHGRHEVGRGMGLAICQRIIHRHGGAVRCHALDDGTIIDFTLPTKEFSILTQEPRGRRSQASISSRPK